MKPIEHTIPWIKVVTILLGVIIIIYALYFIMNLTPKKDTIESKIAQIKEQNLFWIQAFEKGKLFSKITLEVTLPEETMKEYHNYTLGKGEGRDFCFQIVLQNQENLQELLKLKTVIWDKNLEENKIYLKCAFWNYKCSNQKFNVSVLQTDTIEKQTKLYIGEEYIEF